MSNIEMYLNDHERVCSTIDMVVNVLLIGLSTFFKRVMLSVYFAVFFFTF